MPAKTGKDCTLNVLKTRPVHSSSILTHCKSPPDCCQVPLLSASSQGPWKIASCVTLIFSMNQLKASKLAKRSSTSGCSTLHSAFKPPFPTLTFWSNSALVQCGFLHIWSPKSRSVTLQPANEIPHLINTIRILILTESI